jgi:hypothetical protein
MAINVVVSGSSGVGVEVIGADDPIELNVTGGVGPGAPPSVDFIVAGDGITVATASGQVVISGRSTAAISGIAPVQQVQGRTGNVVIVAGDITSGVFDVARIPVLPSENQVVSSGTIANLTSGQQDDIVKGTIVTTTDGRRWVYSGSGSKTDSASYVELADITPDWSVIANKPTTFTPSSHTHSTTDIVSFTASIQDFANVKSVQGRTGDVVLTLQDVTGAAAVHTHDASAIASGTLDMARIPVISYTSLSDVPLSFRPSSHTHSTTEIASFTASIQEFANVKSVQGRNGDVVLTLGDVTGAAAVHTHATSDIVDFTASIQEFANVKSVQGRVGDVVLTLGDVTGAASVHTHGTNDILNFTASIQEFANVKSVQGRVGDVVLTLEDVTGAAAVHTHGTNDIAGLTATFSQVGHTHDPQTDILPSQGGYSGPLATDGTTAGWVSRFSIVDPVLVEGSGVTIARDSNAGSVTVSSKVFSVNSATGDVTVSVASISAAGSSHSHLAADVSNFTTVANVVSVNGITGTPVVVAGSGVTVSTSGSSISISSGSGLPSEDGYGSNVLGTDGTNASWVSRFSIVDDVVVAGAGISFLRNTTSGSITFEAAGGTSGVTVGSATPLSLGTAAAGTSGNASREDHVHAMPSASDVGAAAAVHTHGTTDIVGFTASIQEFANVKSVQGRTGDVVLNLEDVTGAAAVHTHATTDIVGLTASIQSFANVKSVQGRTGDVVLTLEDVTGAAAVHTHGTTDIVGFTTVANVVSVNGITGTPSIVAGANVTVTTSASSIVVAAGGGGDEGGGGIALSYLFS